jgi:hypothetical protein
MTTKICKTCNLDKPISDYYIAYKNNDNNIYTSLCKPCHNNKKTIYNQSKPKILKPNSFMKLEESKRNAILEDVKNKLKYKEIARKHDIRYNMMMFWKNKGYLTIPTQSPEGFKTEPSLPTEPSIPTERLNKTPEWQLTDRCNICGYLEFNCHCGTGYSKYH